MDIVDRLREAIIADAFEAGRIRSGVLAERLMTERLDAADEIESLRLALGWYADTRNYQLSGWQGDLDPPPVLLDGGKRARFRVDVPKTT